jgi:hypothetical protein
MLATTALGTGQFLAGWAIAAAAIAVFLDATKRGDRHATAWGAGVFSLLIVFLPLYVMRRRRSPHAPTTVLAGSRVTLKAPAVRPMDDVMPGSFAVGVGLRGRDSTCRRSLLQAAR